MARQKNLRDSMKVVSPSWLRGKWGERFLYVFGLQLDALWDWVLQGVRSKMPGYGPPDALPAIGNDRQIFRGPLEPEANYVKRLQQAFPTWKKAGNARAVLSQISAYFSNPDFGYMYIVNGVDETGASVADYTTLDGAGNFTFQRARPSNWDWDGDTTQVRFWIVLFIPGSFTYKFWNDGGKWGDGGVWTINSPIPFVADVRKLIFQWKAAGSHCWKDGGIIVVIRPEDPSPFDPTTPPGPPHPDGTWGDPTNRDNGPIYMSGI